MNPLWHTWNCESKSCPVLTPIGLFIKFDKSKIKTLVWRNYRYIYIRWCCWNKNGSFLNEGMIFILLRAFLEHWQNRDRTARKGSLAFCISLSVISLQKLTIVMFNVQFSSKKSLSVLLNRPCYITWSSRELEWRLI